MVKTGKSLFLYLKAFDLSINEDCRKRIQEKVTAAFKEEVEKSKQPGYKPVEIDEPDDDVPEIVS